MLMVTHSESLALGRMRQVSARNHRIVVDGYLEDTEAFWNMSVEVRLYEEGKLLSIGSEEGVLK